MERDTSYFSSANFFTTLSGPEKIEPPLCTVSRMSRIIFLGIHQGNPLLSLMPTGLIDEHKFLVHPIIMGSGKRFFKDGMGMTRLKLIDSKTLSLGVVVLTFQPDRKESK